ncbi:MAG: hypothetical protein U0231_02045 [Nitrospiraceae bacterium]
MRTISIDLMRMWWSHSTGKIRPGLFVFLMLSVGCSLEQELSRTPRTAVEQVLLTQAVTHAVANMSLQVPAGVNIEVDATGLESDRSVFA